jgi:integrase
MRRCRQDLGDVTVDRFIDWMVEKIKPGLASNSWRQYRSAVLWILERSGKPAHLAAALKLKQSGAGVANASGARTSSNKLKRLPADDLGRLVAFLSTASSKYAPALVSYLHASTGTGLRPCEWATAKFMMHPDGSATLTVSNAKRTNGRGHGDVRTLTWADANAVEVEAIVATIDLLKPLTRVQAASLYKAMQRLLRTACSALWPKRRSLTLYDGRHEFAAGMKVLTSRLETAAVLGHASDETATVHYGRRRDARGVRRASLPAAAAAEISRVRQVFEARFDRLRDRRSALRM